MKFAKFVKNAKNAKLAKNVKIVKNAKIVKISVRLNPVNNVQSLKHDLRCTSYCCLVSSRLSDFP